LLRFMLSRSTRLFFFSSRRRHTRFSRDWSSDVCSSDLGRPDSTFSYSATLNNEGGEELVVDLSANAPSGFVVTFKSGGQEVTSLPLGPDANERITIEAEPLGEVQAGTYPITVYARGGDVEAALELSAEGVGHCSVV